ncbi:MULTISPECIES: porin [Rodentibacter]|uniref:porin n=1 Tax=Rodentibacter TaxID=1960084 RepID=UPI001CFEE4BE|nr:porin [Rodentibacter sp. JRC1]GJI56202.1 porin [Rodentibacter sp. JRC1]
MKKTIIALAVAAMAASSAANAVVVYENKDFGTKIDIDGRASLELRGEKSKRTDLYDEGSRFRVRAFQEIGQGFSALAAVEMRFSSGGKFANDLHAKRVFGGFTHPEIGTLTFGRQLTLGDHIPKANYTYEWGGNVFLDQHKKAVHFMSAKFAGVRFAADYYFGVRDKEVKDASGKTVRGSSGNSVWDEGQGYGVGLFYDGKWDDLAVRFGSGYTNVKQSDTGFKADEYDLVRAGVGFDVTYKLVSVGLDWAYGKADKGHDSKNIGFQKIANAGGPFNKNNRFQVGLKVQVTPKNAVYSEYYFAQAQKANIAEKYKMRGWMIGADHKFNKFVSVYLEGGSGQVKHSALADGKFKNHRLVLGTRIRF